MSVRISARNVLMPGGWLANAVVEIGPDGRIGSVGHDGFDAGSAHAFLLPGVANLHTHSFQRAMAGLAETRAPGGGDDFWSWRKVMYRFLELLTPDDIEAIAAKVQLDMAEAGFTSVAEFHYVHHQPGGDTYDDVAETSARIMAASNNTGLGLTHLPVLYSYASLGGAPLGPGQKRFGCTPDEFAKLHAAIGTHSADMPDDFTLGVAPHSLRAVDRDGIAACLALCPDGPLHIHAAEQVREVEEVTAHLGARPVRWLLDNASVEERWCLIHATHMNEAETVDLARSGAAAGLCPTTEANLGDGTFPAPPFLAAGGRFGIGSDSNIRLSLCEELRLLELSQRLDLQQRTVLADDATPSNGRSLYSRAATGGAQAIGRNAGTIEPGRLADLIALSDNDPLMQWSQPDNCLDAWIFGLECNPVTNVWSAGRHIVRESRHTEYEPINSKFAATMRRLRDAL